MGNAELAVWPTLILIHFWAKVAGSILARLIIKKVSKEVCVWLDYLDSLQVARHSTFDYQKLGNISRLGYYCYTKARSSNTRLMKTTGPHEDTNHFLVSYPVLFCYYVAKFIPLFFQLWFWYIFGQSHFHLWLSVHLPSVLQYLALE